MTNERTNRTGPTPEAMTEAMRWVRRQSQFEELLGSLELRVAVRLAARLRARLLGPGRPQ